MSDYIDALADFALTTHYSDVPPHVIEHAKLIFADTLTLNCDLVKYVHARRAWPIPVNPIVRNRA